MIQRVRSHVAELGQRVTVHTVRVERVLGQGMQRACLEMDALSLLVTWCHIDRVDISTTNQMQMMTAHNLCHLVVMLYVVTRHRVVRAHGVYVEQNFRGEVMNIMHV